MTRISGARTVLISGMHSGPNPSPGLGVVRSLRLTGDDLRLIGLDYAASSSGTHSPLLDEVVLLPPWKEVHVATWVEQVLELVEDGGAVFVPTLDLEVHLLAEMIGPHDQILAPNKSALELTSKPPFAVAESLDLAPAPSTTVRDRAGIERFLRGAPQGGWVKGRFYEAFRVHTADEALAAGTFMDASWGSGWHLEAHVPGQECGIAFCARDGCLLDAVFMSKVLLTAEGKTWSGEIAEVPPDLLARLSSLVSEIGWTGGGEVELIRAWDGRITVMELNPRFPAWVHGASVCGANLPATLVRHAAGSRSRLKPNTGFTRIVEEIVIHPDLGVVPYQWASEGAVDPATKHPSGMRALGVRRLVNGTAAGAVGPAALGEPDPLTTFEELLDPPDDLPTPRRQWLLALFARRVEALRASLAPLGPVVLAHSVKTCPHPAVLGLAADLGLVAEAISLDELDTATASGLGAERSILNGPAKWWPLTERGRCWAFFADSLSELDLLQARLEAGFDLTADVVGLRVRPATVPSRFGVPLTTAADLTRAATLVGQLCDRLGASWGLHFHMQSSVVGSLRWRHEATAALRTAWQMATPLGTGPAVVDLGGGWHVDDLPNVAADVGHVMRSLGLTANDGQIVLEPGKLLAEPAAAVISRVLVDDPSGDVVVDAALGDIPEARYRAHPVAHFREGRWTRLLAGSNRVLGRSCMESDILATAVDCRDVRPGDAIAFGMCGAYDLSMAYPFGRGRASDGLDR